MTDSRTSKTVADELRALADQISNERATLIIEIQASHKALRFANAGRDDPTPCQCKYCGGNEPIPHETNSEPARFSVAISPEGRCNVYDDDFGYDAMLRLSGDWAPEEAKKYAEAVAKALNAMPPPTAKEDWRDRPAPKANVELSPSEAASFDKTLARSPRRVGPKANADPLAHLRWIYTYCTTVSGIDDPSCLGCGKPRYPHKASAGPAADLCEKHGVVRFFAGGCPECYREKHAVNGIQQP